MKRADRQLVRERSSTVVSAHRLSHCGLNPGPKYTRANLHFKKKKSAGGERFIKPSSQVLTCKEKAIKFIPRLLQNMTVCFVFQCYLFHSIVSKSSPLAHLHVVGMLRFMFSTQTSRAYPHPFYSLLVSISVFMALSTEFHSINSPNSSLISHSVLGDRWKFVFNPDLNLCG